MIFGPKPGVWWVQSKSDPRWNGGGRADAFLVSSGGPNEIQEHISKRERELGEPPPDDLEYGAMKD